MKNNTIVFVIGFLILFTTYGLIFGLFLNDYSMSLIAKYPSVFRNTPSIPIISLGHSLQTILLIFLFKKMNVNTLMKGVYSGFIVFLLFEAIFSIFIYATLSIIPITDILFNIFLSSMIGIFGGGSIGFLLGKFN